MRIIILVFVLLPLIALIAPKTKGKPRVKRPTLTDEVVEQLRKDSVERSRNTRPIA
jgi:hypothetical protein